MRHRYRKLNLDAAVKPVRKGLIQDLAIREIKRKFSKKVINVVKFGIEIEVYSVIVIDISYEVYNGLSHWIGEI